MTTLRKRNYELSCSKIEFSELVGFLEFASVSKRENMNGYQRFIMPNDVVISVQYREDNSVSFNVRRTSLTEPRYIKKIIQRFGGVPDGSMRISLTGLTRMFIGEDEEDFREKREPLYEKSKDYQERLEVLFPDNH